MRFKFYYWVYDKSLPHQFCDDVIKHCKTLQSQKALIGNKNIINKVVKLEIPK